MHKPRYRYKNNKNIELQEYECEYYTVLAPKKSCFFCDHCTDIFFDLSNGPYLFICENELDNIDDGLNGNCNDFENE